MKSILITGCSSGIGYCVAKALHQQGYHVMVTARKEKDINRLQNEGFLVQALELADSDSVEACVRRVKDWSQGKLFAVFHNAAYGQPGALEDVSRAVLEKQFAANVFGWHQLNNGLIPLFRNNQQGRIILNSSILGFMSMTFRGPYCMSKYAIEGMADALRQELHGSGVFVSLIEPGPITSQFRHNAIQALQENVDTRNSVFRYQYHNFLERAQRVDSKDPFTLGPEAVLSKVRHALESKRPRPRYRVTFPTYLFYALKRILPTRWFDHVVRPVSRSQSK